MSIVTEIENAEFKSFLELFWKHYNYKELLASDKKLGAEIEAQLPVNELAQGMKRFYELLSTEISILNFQSRQSLGSESSEVNAKPLNVPTPYIDFAQKNPYVFFFSFFWQKLKDLDYFNHLKKMLHEIPDYRDNLHPITLFKLFITSNKLYSSNTRDLYLKWFTVFPELMESKLLCELATQSTFLIRSEFEAIRDCINDEKTLTSEQRSELIQSINNGLRVDGKGNIRLPSAVEEENFAPFLDAFYKAIKDPSPGVIDDDGNLTLSYHEQNVRFALVKFQSLLSYKPKENYTQIVKQHPLVFLYVFNTHHLMDKGFSWARDYYGDRIDKLDNKIFLLGMMQTVRQIKTFFEFYPELWSIQFFESKELINSELNFKELYQYLLDIKVILSPQMRRNILLGTFQNFRVGAFKSIQSFSNLFFFLSNGFSLTEANDEQGKWYQHISWHDLREQHAFLFDHLEETTDEATDREEILIYLRHNFSNLVYHHLLLGNFFIANQLINFGLEKPEINVRAFLAEAIHIGLKNSKEMKKYHALVLLQQHAGVVDPDTLKITKDEFLAKFQSNIIQKIEDRIPALIDYYLNVSAELMLEEDSLPFSALNRMMQIIETDYALALSTLYNLPIFNNENEKMIKFFRGLSLPRSPIYEELIQFYLIFGHRSSFYTFLGHGFNRDVYEKIAEGPKMAWNSQSDTTHITPDAGVAQFFSSPEQSKNGFLISMNATLGAPFFWGNWAKVGVEEGMPYQLEMPFIPGDAIANIARYDEHGEVDLEIFQESAHPDTSIDPTVVEQSERNIRERLKFYRENIYSPYAVFLKNCNFESILSKFEVYTKTFDRHQHYLQLKMQQVQTFFDQYKVIGSSSAALVFEYCNFKRRTLKLHQEPQDVDAVECRISII